MGETMRLATDFRKACDCAGTSRTGQVQFGPVNDDGTTVVIGITFIPGPSCDVCGKAWIKGAEGKAT